MKWKRGIRSNTQFSYRMIWRSGDYEVQECTSKYEKDDNGKPVIYCYSIKDNRIIGRHRTKATAFRACEKDGRK